MKRCMRFLRALAPSFAVVLALCAPAIAVDTQVWEHADASDFEKGTLTGLSLSSEGHLNTAPLLKQIHDPSLTFLWAVARDSKGTVWAGGGGASGSKAKLVGIDATGNARSVELDGMAVQAIAIDKQNRVYAATSPDGKVYRLDPAAGANSQPQVFYDPKAKYIWALAFSKTGDLYVATGDGGEIHKVSGNGTGSVFYRTEETNVRSLAMDANDNIIAGTDGNGLVLRISPAGQGFVLYEAAKREITALAVAADNTIYAAGTGNKGTAPPSPATVTPAPARPTPSTQGAVLVITGGPGRGNAAVQNTPAPPVGVPGGSEVYRIQPDGYARRVWSHRSDVVYAMAFDGQDRVLLGTGNEGNVYRLDARVDGSERTYTKLLSVAPSQVTGFAGGPNGRVYVVTSNIGEVFSMGPEREASGTYESEVLDAGAFSYWGRLTPAFLNKGDVSLETRSGNLSRAQKDWSPWAKLTKSPNGERAASPPARFLQYRATISGDAELYDLTIAYEMKNAAPVVDMIESTPPNYKFPAPVTTGSAANPSSLTLPALGRTQTASSSSPSSDPGTSPSLTWAKGFIGARWLANDENGDTLQFSIEIRGENETGWKPLRDHLQEHYYSWDSTAFPDGKYRVRITATDAPSNTPEQALESSRISDRFLIDNTPPEITGLAGTVNGNKIEVRFHAKDTWNVLQKAEYSLNGGRWTVAEPTTRLTDSEEHDYSFQVDKPAGEATIAVRVSDAYDNEAVAKTVVK